jgi:predicted DsbA family dithiol-disulfide isomerase
MTSQSEPLRVDVVSDVVCPWCFIGKRRLEKALALRPDLQVEVHYHPYFLNDWVPRDGMARADYLTTKFGSVERYAAMAERISAAALAEGLDYRLEKIARQPNTIDCHRLILWAEEIGQAAAMKQRLMDLYFTDGADLSDREVLVGAAGDCGLDSEETRARLASDVDLDRVTAMAERAKASGIDGVPFFILNNQLGVSGAQSPETLARALDQADAERGRPVAAAE